MLAFSLESTHHQFGHGVAASPRSIIVPLVVLALIFFVVKYFHVIVHEGAHAIAGWSMGRRVASVKINSDATGETLILKGPGSGFTGFVGYLGPSAFGLVAAVLISLGYARAVLWLALLLLTLILFRVRNLFGVASVLANGALFVLLLSHGSPKLQVTAAYVLSWLLLLAGVGVVLTDGSNAGDAVNLRKMTHLPRFLWSLLWLAITVAALVAGARLLTRPA